MSVPAAIFATVPWDEITVLARTFGVLAIAVAVPYFALLRACYAATGRFAASARAIFGPHCDGASDSLPGGADVIAAALCPSQQLALRSVVAPAVLPDVPAAVVAAFLAPDEVFALSSATACTAAVRSSASRGLRDIPVGDASGKGLRPGHGNVVFVGAVAGRARANSGGAH